MVMKSSKERIYSLDMFKAVAAFMVVAMHIKFSEMVPKGDYLQPIARIAVPFFFMVSGYFAYSPEDSAVYKKSPARLKHYLWLMLLADVIYLLYKMIQNLDSGSFWSPVAKIFSPKFLLSNMGVGIAGHIWFLRALIYVTLLYMLFLKVGIAYKLKWILGIVWLIDLVLCKYSLALFGRLYLEGFQKEFFTKFFGVALIFFFLGIYIRKWRSEHPDSWLFSGSNKTTAILGVTMAVAFIGNLLEYRWLKINEFNVMPANYFFTLPLTVTVFLLLLSRPSWGKGSIVYYIGVKLSLWIYILHPLIIKLLRPVCKAYMEHPGIILNPISIYIISCGAALIIVKVSQFVKK